MLNVKSEGLVVVAQWWRIYPVGMRPWIYSLILMQCRKRKRYYTNPLSKV